MKKILILTCIISTFITATPSIDEESMATIAAYIANLQRLGKKEHNADETIDTILGTCSPIVTAHIHKHSSPADQNPENFSYDGRDIFRDYFYALHEHAREWFLIIQKKAVTAYEPFTVTIEYRARPFAAKCHDGKLQIRCNAGQIIAIDETITTQWFR